MCIVCVGLSEQQQLNSSIDDETAAILNDGYTLEEKERLKEEWLLFDGEKRNFERERKNFTDAAIRLGREVLSFVYLHSDVLLLMCGSCRLSINNNQATVDFIVQYSNSG